MSHPLGIFCVSVDGHENPRSAETLHRRRELIELMERFDVPSNWTVEGHRQCELPSNAEITVGATKAQTRCDLVQHLRRMTAALLRSGTPLNSIILDPQEARKHWDILVRHGCVVARPRKSSSATDADAKILRGGLWAAPICCSFVGGSRRSVRSLFSVCQRRLVESAIQGRLFHLNIDLSNQRDSWQEEKEALRALFETAGDQRRKNSLQCAHLGDLPTLRTKKSDKPMLSILRRAA